MSKIENLIDIARLNELLGRKEEEKEMRRKGRTEETTTTNKS